MKTSLTIVHLSDAHIGNPKHDLDFLDVTRPLFQDLSTVREQRGLQPDLVVFSGDLAFGELPSSPLNHQYEIANSWLDNVYTSLGCSRSTVPLLIVPGNHDVNRFSVGEDQVAWLDSLSGENGSERLEAEMKSNGVLWQRILERQREWADFVRALGLPWTFDSNLFMTTGFIEREGAKIGLAGINTSWGCSREREHGRLWIGKYQAQRAWNALSQCDFKIVVTHHPTSWLNEAEQSWMEQKLESNFHLHLHGHQHDQWFSDSKGHLRIAAGPCYAGSSAKENAYSWIKIDFGSHSAQVHLREYKRKGSGGWGPFFIWNKTSENGIADIDNLFPSTIKRLQSHHAGLTAASAIGQIDNILSLIRALEEYFGLRWEPGTFTETPEPSIVYWPVRLRPATPIHAVQAFVAAALQKKGANVFLFLDDLGNTDITAEAFILSIKRWFDSVGAHFESLEIRLFSSVITMDRAPNTWTMVRKWLAENHHRLDKILEVSKLTSAGEELKLESLLQKRPRRLLTPPLVWACLSYLQQEFPQGGVITLGGYDEVILWKAWRDGIQVSGSKVGHLYAPVLQDPFSGSNAKPLHMAKKNLAWDSRADIIDALEEDRLASPDAQHWLSKGRMAEWCLRGTILLPAFVKGESAEWHIAEAKITPNSDFKTLQAIDHSLVSQEISKAVARWVLS